MRVDHHACHRATITSVTGLILQIAIATSLLVFGLIANSTPFVLVSFYIWIGIIVWLGLIILFYQQKMQLLEVLEESELAGGDATSIFETGGDEVRPAAARLRLIHRWVMPAVSIFIAASLIVISVLMLRYLGRVEELGLELQKTEYIGWALAVSLGFALTSFIYSRFVAGMADVPAWANLRGGSAWVVGNAIILIALATGLLFRFFDNEQVLFTVCWGIPIFMIAVSAEIVINFVLNLYRPRIQGESPRPAFDSKTLSLFASPDSLVRSLNEAINYQFGFDITSSWGYQLFLRSVAWLLALGFIVLLGMSTMVVVEPTQQAVRIRQGSILGEVHKPGLMFKLPWPVEEVLIVDVTRVREIPLTFSWKDNRPVILWTDDYNQLAITKPKPFIVNDAQRSSKVISNDLLSLVDVRAVLRYKVAQDGLLDWLAFGSNDIERRTRRTQRESALLAISQKVITEIFQKLQLDDVLGGLRVELTQLATDSVQAVFDELHTGVKVVSIDFPLVSPAGNSAQSFEELSVAQQGEARLIAAAEGQAQGLLTNTVGDPLMVSEVVNKIASYNDAKREWDTLRRDTSSNPETLEQAFLAMQTLEHEAIALLEKGNGRAAAHIRSARVDRWTTLMDTWSRANRVQGQLAAFKAAPELYMQRMYMSVLARQLPSIRKYVIGIDPGRINLDLEMRNINPLLNFADSLESDEEGDQ